MAYRTAVIFLFGLASLCLVLSGAELSAQLGSEPVSPYELPATALIYVSDYFSFVGADQRGRVAFALDNNRGRDGEAYQAEHFVVLHDERKGWMNVAGNGRYHNAQKELGRIPNSPFFQFDGTPETGLTVTSPTNDLMLKIDPIPQRTRRTHERSVIWMGSAPAVLTWQGRTIPGRVIYESLVMPDFNRLTRTYFRLWNDFQGLYLLAGKDGDLYLHSQRSERLAALAGRLVGFAVLNEQTDPMNQLRVEVLARDWALGFYRWPTAWGITWNGTRGPASMTLRLSDQKKIANWVIGGFSMGVVQGELVYDGRTWPLYGLAELIM